MLGGRIHDSIPPHSSNSQVFPTVSSVTPAIGSVAGGTLVTIRGAGFPEIDQQPAAAKCNNGWGDGDGVGGGRSKDDTQGSCSGAASSASGSTLSITVGGGGAPCDIVSSTFDTALCLTRPLTQAAAQQQATVGGTSAGLRGISLDTFNRRCGQA